MGRSLATPSVLVVRRLACLPAALAVAMVISASTMSAQDSLEALRAKLMLPEPDPAFLAQAGRFGRGAPGTSSGSPMAFGPNFRDVFFGAGYQARARYRKQSDGSVSGGFGLGNARDALGLEVVVTSLSTIRSGFGDRLSFSFKAHRLLSGMSAVAVGVENAVMTGTGSDAGRPSVYVVGTRIIPFTDSPARPLSALTVSAGIGNSRFRSEQDVFDDRKTVNVFGSVSVRVIEQLSVIADWGGQDLSVALGIAPMPSLFPLSITASLNDVTGTAGDGARLSIGAGFGFRFQ